MSSCGCCKCCNKIIEKIVVTYDGNSREYPINNSMAALGGFNLYFGDVVTCKRAVKIAGRVEVVDSFFTDYTLEISGDIDNFRAKDPTELTETRTTQRLTFRCTDERNLTNFYYNQNGRDIEVEPEVSLSPYFFPVDDGGDWSAYSHLIFTDAELSTRMTDKLQSYGANVTARVTTNPIPVTQPSVGPSVYSDFQIKFVKDDDIYYIGYPHATSCISINYEMQDKYLYGIQLSSIMRGFIIKFTCDYISIINHFWSNLTGYTDQTIIKKTANTRGATIPGSPEFGDCKDALNYYGHYGFNRGYLQSRIGCPYPTRYVAPTCGDVCSASKSKIISGNFISYDFRPYGGYASILNSFSILNLSNNTQMSATLGSASTGRRGSTTADLRFIRYPSYQTINYVLENNCCSASEEKVYSYRLKYIFSKTFQTLLFQGGIPYPPSASFDAFDGVRACIDINDNTNISKYLDIEIHYKNDQKETCYSKEPHSTIREYFDEDLVIRGFGYSKINKLDISPRYEYAIVLDPNQKTSDNEVLTEPGWHKLGTSYECSTNIYDSKPYKLDRINKNIIWDEDYSGFSRFAQYTIPFDDKQFAICHTRFTNTANEFNGATFFKKMYRIDDNYSQYHVIGQFVFDIYILDKEGSLYMIVKSENFENGIVVNNDLSYLYDLNKPDYSYYFFNPLADRSIAFQSNLIKIDRIEDFYKQIRLYQVGSSNSLNESSYTIFTLMQNL